MCSGALLLQDGSYWRKSIKKVHSGKCAAHMCTRLRDTVGNVGYFLMN